MDMTPQTVWLIGILAVLIVGVAAFFIGRGSASGDSSRVEELEAELRSKQQEVDAYRKDVEAHFDRTATLFVGMAGSYKGLFEHLSEGYEKLSTGSARELFQQRVDALLIGTARSADEQADRGKLLGAAATAAVASAAAASAAANDTATADETPITTAQETPIAAAQEAAITVADAQPDATSAQTIAKVAPEPEATSLAAASPEAARVQADEIARQAEGGSFDFGQTPDASAQAGDK